MIIRNYASCSIEVLTPADNRPQTTVHGPQLTQVNYKPYFLSVLVEKRILGKSVWMNSEPSFSAEK